MRSLSSFTHCVARAAVAFGLLALAAAPAGRLVAQTTQAAKKSTAKMATLDRDKVPTPGALPVLHVPKWTKVTLSNGAQLIVTAKHNLPLVAFSINFIGGSDNFEPTGKTGVASFASQMLSEGTTTKTADQISDAQQRLGTNIFATVSGEAGSIRFTSLKSKFEPALALLADMLVNPSFPSEALERLRGRTLVNLTQQRDQPNAIASNVFAHVLYGDGHPYGHVMTDATVKAITRDDIVQFHKDYFRPGRAVISVSGDVNPATVRASVEKALAQWPAGGSPPSFDYPAVPAPKERAIYLVDKPGAAQSVFAMGEPGPPRNTTDWYSLQVMNNILGVLFQSRLNHDIREEKGYSYGVSSNFAYGRGPGAFRAGGGIVTAKSDSAMIEFMKQLKGVQGDIPFSDDEMKQGRESLIQSLPDRFASVNATGTSIASLYTQGLPETFFQDYGPRISAVTSDDLVRVAKKYLDVNHMVIVVVGDRKTIEDPLRKTGIAPIQILDVDGKPVVVP